MKVICQGADVPSIEQVQLAIRFRWPDASFYVAPTHQDALGLVEGEGADLVVIIARGSKTSAPELCAQLREFSDVAIIVMGDDGEYSLDDVKALEAGADDYIRFSAGLAEIVARVVALIRRVHAQGSSPSGNVVQIGDLLLNPATYEVFLQGRRVDLTATEFNLLHLLIRNKGAVVRHRMIERALWGDYVDSSSVVKKYVHRLRRKFDVAGGGQHEYIRSIYSIGYLFVSPSEAREAKLEPVSA